MRIPNLEYLIKKIKDLLGTTSISSIGDGTVTGAISSQSDQFFNVSTPTDGRLPQEVLNRVYAICDADGNKASIDYAMCQVVEDNGATWRTEVVKPMPAVQS